MADAEINFRSGESKAKRRRSVRRMKTRRVVEKGFSLIELIIVLVILGLVAGIVGLRVFKQVPQAKRKVAEIQISQIAGALELFASQIGRYPSTDEGLEALIRNQGGLQSWNGPYLKKTEVPKDPWEKPYVYRCPGEHDDYDLYSYGPDGAEGGEGDNADIVSWK
jgi:general secretion pathway protein G